ncbi:MAG: hypothetical protein ACP5OZ_01235 [Candidatus Woesearchaeota archaeon]
MIKSRKDFLKKEKARFVSANSLLLIVLILLIVFISGCVSESGISIFNPYIGNQGAEVNFMKNAPPDFVFEDSSFHVGFELENKGALNVEKGIITIGLSDIYGLSIDKRTINFELKGKKDRRSIYGEKKYEIVQAKAPKLEGKAQSEFLINMIACYQYSTFLQTSICVNPDHFNPKPENCNPTPLQFSSQGSPVAVRRVEQSVIPVSEKQSKLMFTIYVENIGDGFVTLKDSYHKICSNLPLKVQDVDYLEVSAKLGHEDLTCSPKKVVLKQGKGYVTCYSKPLDIQPSYKTSLSVKVDFGYFYSKTKNVLIYKLFD